MEVYEVANLWCILSLNHAELAKLGKILDQAARHDSTDEDLATVASTYATGFKALSIACATGFWLPVHEGIPEWRQELAALGLGDHLTPISARAWGRHLQRALRWYRATMSPQGRS